VASPAGQPVLVDCARDSRYADAGILAGALRDADLGSRAISGGASKRRSGHVVRTPHRCRFDEYGAGLQLRAARTGTAHVVGRTRAGADPPVFAAAVACAPRRARVRSPRVARQPPRRRDTVRRIATPT